MFLHKYQSLRRRYLAQNTPWVPPRHYRVLAYIISLLYRRRFYRPAKQTRGERSRGECEWGGGDNVDLTERHNKADARV